MDSDVRIKLAAVVIVEKRGLNNCVCMRLVRIGFVLRCVINAGECYDLSIRIVRE